MYYCHSSLASALWFIIDFDFALFTDPKKRQNEGGWDLTGTSRFMAIACLENAMIAHKEMARPRILFLGPSLRHCSPYEQHLDIDGFQKVQHHKFFWLCSRTAFHSAFRLPSLST